MATRAHYVIQPYAHLEPVRRCAKRYALKLLEVKPSEVPQVIEAVGTAYCGLTPLPLTHIYGLEVVEGPMVYTLTCSPSVVLETYGGDICKCRKILVTRESIASYTYIKLATHTLCSRPPSVAYEGEEDGALHEENICRLYIGDKGARIYEARREGIVELAEVYYEAFKVYPVFAVTAGPGCIRLRDVLRRMSRLRYTLLDVIHVASRLRVSINTASRYLECTKLDYNDKLARRNIEILQEYKHLIRLQPIAR